jgi:hypothetical protein
VRLLLGWGNDAGSSMNTAPGSSGSTPAGVGTRSSGSGASMLLVIVLRLGGCGWSCDCAPAWLRSCNREIYIFTKLHGVYLLPVHVQHPEVDNLQHE